MQLAFKKRRRLPYPPLEPKTALPFMKQSSFDPSI